MRFVGLVSIACLGGLAAAYSNSAYRGENPVHCVGFPFGECETIMASGWAKLLQGYGAGYNLEAAVATFVPLLMWLTLIMSTHNPRLTMRRPGVGGAGSKKISPGGWIYGLLFLVVVGVSAMTIMEK